MKKYFVGEKEITEQEAKEIEKHNQEIFKRGSVKELLEMQIVTVDRSVLEAKSRGSHEGCRTPWEGSPDVSCQAWKTRM